MQLGQSPLLKEHKFYFYVALWFVFVSFLHFEIAKLVRDPYMDEIFHFPQFREFCLGNWGRWDPMITTPPGLYYASLFLLAPMRLFKGTELMCSLSAARLTNLLFGLGILLVSRKICHELKMQFADERALLIALIPTLYPFVGLYYTDIGSSFFCLLALLCLIQRKSLSFIFFAIVSILFRQTNIIWTGVFFLADSIYRRLQLKHLDGQDISKGLALCVREVFARWLLVRFEVSCGALLATIFFTGIFVNGGIVMGDRQNHIATLHYAQFFYCMVAILAFIPPIKFTRSKMTSFLVLTTICLLAVRFGTVVHPYLLADNRHWTNVVWRRVVDQSVVYIPARYLLAPVYAFCTQLVFDTLPNGNVWKLGLFSCLAFLLVPSPLIEPRYYLFPTIVYVLYGNFNGSRLHSSIIWTLLVNIILSYVFLYRPFAWPHEPAFVQRYIW